MVIIILYENLKKIFDKLKKRLNKLIQLLKNCEKWIHILKFYIFPI